MGLMWSCKSSLYLWVAESLPNTDELFRMADVMYNTASFHSLLRTLKNVMEVGRPSRNTRPLFVLMGYKERHPDERNLWVMAQEIGLDFVRVGERVGAGNCPVEVWVCVAKDPPSSQARFDFESEKASGTRLH